MTTVLTLVLTAALVLVTGYYAWQNHQMVLEMREDRRERAMLAALVPKSRLIEVPDSYTSCRSTSHRCWPERSATSYTPPPDAQPIPHVSVRPSRSSSS